MTKETIIIYWLSTFRPAWTVQYYNDAVVYTITGGLVIEYRFNEAFDNECTVWRDGKVECFGTVEYCLKYIKKPG